MILILTCRMFRCFTFLFSVAYACGCTNMVFGTQSSLDIPTTWLSLYNLQCGSGYNIVRVGFFGFLFAMISVFSCITNLLLLRSTCYSGATVKFYTRPVIFSFLEYFIRIVFLDKCSSSKFTVFFKMILECFVTADSSVWATKNNISKSTNLNGNPPIACSGKPILNQKKAEPLTCTSTLYNHYYDHHVCAHGPSVMIYPSLYRTHQILSCLVDSNTNLSSFHHSKTFWNFDCSPLWSE